MSDTPEGSEPLRRFPTPADLKSAAELLMNGHISKYPVEDLDKGGEFQRGMLAGLLTAYELMVTPESYAADARVHAAKTLLTRMFMMLYPRGETPTAYHGPAPKPADAGLLEFAKQGEPAPISTPSPCCPVCDGELPCRNHPAPPVLTFIGGTHFDETPNYRTTEQCKAPADDSCGADNSAGRGNVPARAPAGGAVAAATSGDAPFGWPPVRPEISGEVSVSASHGQTPAPGHVQEASARLSTASNVVVLGGDTTLDLPPERVLAGAKQLRDVIVLGYDEAGHEYFASSLGDPTEQLWLVERFKLMLMDLP